MARKVKLLRLHQAVHIPGIGMMGDALEDGHKAILKGLSMEKVDGGFDCTIGKSSFFIPTGNVSIALYMPEESKNDK